MNIPAPAILRDYTVASNRVIAEGVFELVLVPLRAEDRIPDPRAGQWVMLHLLEADGTIFGKNPYSIVNAPVDVVSSGRVELVIREAGTFTQRAKALRAGEIVKVQGPFGVFTLVEGAARHAFFAGGMARHAAPSMILASPRGSPKRRSPSFYSRVRRAKRLPRSQDLAASHPNVSFIPTFTRETDNVRGRTRPRQRRPPSAAISVRATASALRLRPSFVYGRGRGASPNGWALRRKIHSSGSMRWLANDIKNMIDCMRVRRFVRHLAFVLVFEVCFVFPFTPQRHFSAGRS